MNYALNQGVNFFDTAEMYAVPPTQDTYGKTETIIGTWFKEQKKRDKVVLATKASGPGLSWVRNGQSDHSASHLTEAVEGSLKRLQTEYIDLYQLHWPKRPNYHFGRHWDFDTSSIDYDAEVESIHNTLSALDDLIKQGKIRYVGLSNESAWGTMKFLELSKHHNLPRMVSIQNEYSLTCRLFEPDLAEIARYESIGLLAWSPLAAGALSGKYLNDNMPKGSRRTLLTSTTHRDNKTTDKAIEKYMKLAENSGLDVCQMALAFVNTRPFLTSNIIGATNMEQLKTNIDSINLQLDSSVIAGIQEIYKEIPKPY